MDVAISFPNERRYLDVARLVFGGTAARLDMSYDDVDDVQLAIESVLNADLSLAEEIRLEARVDGTALSIWVGPLDAPSLELRLADGRHGISLQLVLDCLVDSVRPSIRGDATGLLLLKQVLAP